MPANTGCACPNDVLTYVCTVVGVGNTLWEGTAFDCSARSIVLLHTQFDSPEGASGNCNSDIAGRSLSVESDCYTSQLFVTVSSRLNNKTVTCVHNSGIGMIPIGVSTLTVLEGYLNVYSMCVYSFFYRMV